MNDRREIPPPLERNELIWVKGTTPVNRGIHSKQCPNCRKMRTEDELRPGGVHICYGAGIQPSEGL